MEHIKYTYTFHQIRGFFKRYGVFMLLCLLVGGVFTVVGTKFYFDYNSPTSISYDGNYQGFRFAQNETLISEGLIVDLTINPPRLDFQYDCLAPTNDTYSFVFQFPFKVTNVIHESINFRENTKDHFLINATNTGTVISVTTNCNGGTTLYGYFDISNTFYFDSHGSYTIILPFNLPMHGNEIFQQIQGSLNLMPYTSIVPMSLNVGIPPAYSFAQSVPVIDGLNPTSNESLRSYSWNLNQWQTVTITCNDPSEVSRFENMPFLSGIFIGIGTTLWVTAIYDSYKKWVEK